MCVLFVFVVKQKTAFEMRMSDWSSDLCSSDLVTVDVKSDIHPTNPGVCVGWVALYRSTVRTSTGWRSPRLRPPRSASPGASWPGSAPAARPEIGRASCRERVCQYV